MEDPISPIEFHRRLPGYSPTPLVDLERPAAAHLARLALKLETSRYGLPAFKVLGASWAGARRVAAWLGGEDLPADLQRLHTALATRADRPTLVTATDGNHGRAVAWTARQLGIPAAIFVPAGTADARLAAIRAEGATLTVVDGDYDATVDRAAAWAARTSGRLLVQDTAVPGHDAVEWIVDGYATIFTELDAQLGEVEHLVLVVPVGVGSLAVAAARHLGRRGGRSTLVTVEPAEAASLRRSLAEGSLVELPGPHTSCMVGLRCGSISRSAWPVLREAVDEAVALEDAEADDAMRWLAGRGIEVGECGAAALAALRRLERHGRLAELVGARPATVVLLATEAPTDPQRWERVVGRRPASAGS